MVMDKRERYEDYLKKFEDFKKRPNNTAIADSYTYEDLQDHEAVMKEVERQNYEYYERGGWEEYRKRKAEVERIAEEISEEIIIIDESHKRHKRLQIFYDGCVHVGCPLYEKYLFCHNPNPKTFKSLMLSYHLFSYI